MKLINLIFPILLLVGCASQRVVVNPKESEEFGVYVRLFEKEAKEQEIQFRMPNLLSSLRVYMVDSFNEEILGANVVGLCYDTNNRTNIYISKKEWESYDTYQREMLMFHELGHCILQLGHDRSQDRVGRPLDLMFPFNFDSDLYLENREYYVKHLFGQLKSQEISVEGMGRKTHKCRWGIKVKTKEKR